MELYRDYIGLYRRRRQRSRLLARGQTHLFNIGTVSSLPPEACDGCSRNPSQKDP